jgi:uncharacterized membrane protein
MKLAKQKNDGRNLHSAKIDGYVAIHNPAKDLFHLWSNFDNLSAGWDSQDGLSNW